LVELQYRLLAPEEASGLVDFVRNLYGSTYPNSLFYDADELQQQLKAGRLCSAVAETPEGKIVGHFGTYYEYTGDVTADGTTGMVDPDFRGEGVMRHLARPMFARYKADKLAGLHLYAVTLHSITQRQSVDGGAVVTGVLLQDWPGDYEISGFAGNLGLRRMPVVTLFMPLFPDSMPAREVFCPADWQELLKSRYEAIGARRDLAGPGAGGVAARSRCETLLKPAQGAAALRFHRVGRDWEECLEAFLGEAASFPARYLDISLTEAAALALIDHVREAGWYFGALLPERAGTDFCRLQYGLPDEDWSVAHIVEEARPVLDLLK